MADHHHHRHHEDHQAREQARQMVSRLKQRAGNASTWQRLVLFAGIVVALSVGGMLLAGAGFVAFLLAAPLLILFSPVLIPLALFVAACATFVVFCSAVFWLFEYFKGRHPVGTDNVESMKHRAMELGHLLQSRARQVASGA